jgi:ribosomal protein S18 acetylase RimI-like enzyme
MVYRLATETDFPFLVETYEKLNAYYYQVGYRLPRPENTGQAWLESFQRTLGRFSNVFVAETVDENGEPRLVGFVLCRLKRLAAHFGGGLTGEISDVWVEPDARRMGIGEGLLRQAAQWMRTQGAISVEAQILKDNQASLSLFESLGFRLEYRLVRLLWEDYPPPTANG